MSRLASSKTAQIWTERLAQCERSNAPIAQLLADVFNAWSRTARSLGATDWKSVVQGVQVVQPVRRTSSPSGKSYRWINRRDGLEVRRTRRSKRKRAAAPQATAFLRVQTSDSNKHSIEIKIPETGHRPEARGNSQTAYHARWYVPRSIGCLLFDLTSWLNCLCNA